MPPSDSSSGKIDSETAQALRRFQTDRNLRVTGSLDTPSLRALVFPEKTPEE
ncbi:peptidoglycan-binding domain-containing protein [Bradyrhizobium sp. LMG 9283]|uniref:peptidoglycan-binding domain-containing protein n=1 Tax=Bradyrhizobium sp. LMG 9283 TaxID=592064 RepID=UPI00388D3041